MADEILEIEQAPTPRNCKCRHESGNAHHTETFQK